MNTIREFIFNLSYSGLLPSYFQYAFVVNSLFATLLIGPLLAISGSMVVIKKMAFFSETIGHVALTGIALGVLLGENYNSPYIMLYTYCIVFGVLINYVKNRTKMETDTLMGIFLSISIALGAILILFVSAKINTHMLESVLFGSILTVSDFDLKILLITSIILAFLIMFWYNEMLLTSFNKNIAKVKNIKVVLLDYLFIIIVTLITVSSVKIIGASLVEALLIIPAASAKNLSKSMSSFILYSIIFSTLSCILGIILPLSLNLSVPSGPAIILISAIIFFVTVILKTILKKFKEGV